MAVPKFHLTIYNPMLSEYRLKGDVLPLTDAGHEHQASLTDHVAIGMPTLGSVCRIEEQLD
jgi:hypothetical protein